VSSPDLSVFVLERAVHVLICPFSSGRVGRVYIGDAILRSEGMAEKNKIDRYGLGERVTELFREGKTTVEIAEMMTRGLQDSGINDGVDQSTVSRWLKKIREADEEMQAEIDRQTVEVLRLRVEAGVHGDVDQIELVQELFFRISQNTLEGHNFKMKERVYAGQALVKLIDTKLRLPGATSVGGYGAESGNAGDHVAPALPAGSNVHSILGRLKKAVQD
jgi:predicted transcriptional regulator